MEHSNEVDIKLGKDNKTAFVNDSCSWVHDIANNRKWGVLFIIQYCLLKQVIAAPDQRKIIYTLLARIYYIQ